MFSMVVLLGYGFELLLLTSVNVGSFCLFLSADGDFFCYTRHEPVGVCGQIIPVSSMSVENSMQVNNSLHNNILLSFLLYLSIFAHGCVSTNIAHFACGEKYLVFVVHCLFLVLFPYLKKII